MSEFHSGNVVKWHKQLFVVVDDDGNCVTLIPMNNSHSTYHPSKSWPSEKTGREGIKLVSETVYGWLVESLKKHLGIEEVLSADGWTPR